MKKIIVGALLLLVGTAVIVGADQTLDKGTFLFVIGSDQVGIENFTFTQLDGGNLKLSSDFKATSPDLVSEFGTDKLFTQEVDLNPDLTLISYSLDSDTERGTIKARVTVQGQVASMSVETVDPDGNKTSGQRDVILEDNAVTTGITGSQFILLEKYIDTKVKTDQATLLAFNPTDLTNPLVEVKVIKLSPVTLQAGSQTLTAQRVRVERDNFQVELLSKDGQLLGFVSSTATLSGVTLANNPNGAGALVKSVAAGSFAEQAGLRPSDVITEVAGHVVKDRFDAENLIRFQDTSQPLTLTIQRDTQSVQIQVRLSGSNLTTYRQDLFPNGFSVVSGS